MAVVVKYDNTKLRKMLATLKGKPVRILHDGTDYGVFQELGSATRSVPLKPFIGPAIENARPAYEKGWPQVIEQSLMTPDDFIEKLARDAEGVAKDKVPVDTGNLKNSIAVSKPEEYGSHA